MNTGPYVWRPGLLRAKMRVEFVGETMSVAIGEKQNKFSFAEIKDVYFYTRYLPPLTHALLLDIEKRDGETVGVYCSGYGLPSGHDAEECRKAVIAFLALHEEACPGKKIFKGFKGSEKIKWVWSGALVLIMAFAAFNAFREITLEEWPIVLGVVAVVFLITGIVLWRQFKRHVKPIPVDPSDVRQELEAYQQYS